MFRSSRKYPITSSIKDTNTDTHSDNELLRSRMKNLFKKKSRNTRSPCDTSLSTQGDDSEDYYSERSCTNSIISHRDIRISASTASVRSISRPGYRSNVDQEHIQQIELNKKSIENLAEDVKNLRIEVQAIHSELISELQLIRYDMMKDIALLKGAIAATNGYSQVHEAGSDLIDDKKRCGDKISVPRFSAQSNGKVDSRQSESLYKHSESSRNAASKVFASQHSINIDIDVYFPSPDFGKVIKVYGSKLHFETRQWVFHHVKQWISSSFRGGEDRLLALIGSGGTGKSTVAAKLCLNFKANMLACHFSQFDCKRSSLPRNVVLSLINQLACSIPLYKKLLLRLNLRYLLVESDPETLATKLLIQPLSSMSEKPFTEGFILIDGVDQYSADSDKSALLDLLSHLAFNLPKWIGILLTSAPSRTLLMKMPTISILELSTRSKNHMSDIDVLLNRVLLNFEPEAENTVREIISKKASGNLLYLQYIQQALSHPSLRNTGAFVPVDVVDDLPDSLDDIFMDIFQDKFGQGRKRVWKRVKPMLEVIVAAASGPYPLITENQIQKYFDVNGNEWREIRRACSDILYTMSSTVRLSNASLYDWVTNERRAQEFYLNPTNGLKPLRKILTGDSGELDCDGPQTF